MQKLKDWIANNHVTLHVWGGMIFTMSGMIYGIWLTSAWAVFWGVITGLSAAAGKELVIDKLLGLGHPHWENFFISCWGVLWGAGMLLVWFNRHNGVATGIFD